MNAEMEMTIIILWLAGVVCGTGFFLGLGTFAWYVWKKQTKRLVYAVLAMLIGFIGMSNSLFSILRLFRSWG